MACVLDSPYASLWRLVKKIGVERSGLPGFILEGVVGLLRDRIVERHCFDIGELEPVRCMGRMDMPVFFITSLQDEFVSSEEVVEMYRLAPSRRKHLEYIDKAHHAPREK